MRFTVRAPASTANLGPGFDAIGLALDLWNEVTIDTEGEPGAVINEGREAALLEGRENLIVRAMRTLADEVDQQLPDFALWARTEIPVARGLGSSAAALVAGLVAANRLLDLGLSDDDLYAVAWRIEGHGDNVGAALFGGAVLAVPNLRQAVPLWPREGFALTTVVYIPNATGATWAARAALPATVPHADATFNVLAAAGLAMGLRLGDCALIGASMHDRLHEPYRARLYPHLEPMRTAAREAGALGAALSGAGPTVIALTTPDRAAAVQKAMTAVATRLDIPGHATQLAPITTGTHILEPSRVG